MAGAYTVFANGGVHIDPWMLASVRTPTGDIIDDYTPTTQPGARPARRLPHHLHDGSCSARQRGRWLQDRRTGLLRNRRGRAQHGLYWLPRRAKPAPATTPGSPASPATCSASSGSATTTTPRLIRKPRPHSGRAGRRSHLGRLHEAGGPVARSTPTPTNSPRPTASTIVTLDKATNLLADAACPDDYTAAFLDGTAPTDTCDHPNPDHRNFCRNSSAQAKTETSSLGA